MPQQQHCIDTHTPTSLWISARSFHYLWLSTDRYAQRNGLPGKKFDDISAIRHAAKNDFSKSNAKKQEIAEEYRAAGNELRAASEATMALAAKIAQASAAHRAL